MTSQLYGLPFFLSASAAGSGKNERLRRKLISLGIRYRLVYWLCKAALFKPPSGRKESAGGKAAYSILLGSCFIKNIETRRRKRCFLRRGVIYTRRKLSSFWQSAFYAFPGLRFISLSLSKLSLFHQNHHLETAYRRNIQKKHREKT